MTMTLKPRGYQNEALTAIAAELVERTRTAVVLPTGMGKTVVFSHLIARTVADGKAVLVLVHRDELAEQAKDKITSVSPDARVGIVKAERNEVTGRDVIVASVQTLAREARRDFIRQNVTIGLVVVDECHHAVARTWVETLKAFGCFPEDGTVGTPCVGFTATLQRGDGIGLGDVWESVAYERDIEYGIDHGYLTDVRGQLVTVDGFDLATIAKSRGDYQEGRLGDALIATNAGPVVAEAYIEHATRDGEIRRGILFAPTVASAYHFAEAFEEAGIPTAVITGETPKEDRELAYKRFREGDIRVLANCMVLTEGFDAPWAEVAVVARPTQSAPLYTQMVGRVLRPWKPGGKDEALVLDVVGITPQHKLKTLKDLSKIEVREGESIVEAKDRIVAEREEVVKGERLRGEKAAREIDLFASSHSVWLQTKGGTWFIPVRGGYVVLFENADGSWSVGRKMDRQGGEWIVKHVAELATAMSWGEQVAMTQDPTLADKGRTWRRAKASPAQIDLCVRMKLASYDELVDMRRGAVSDMLSIHFASRDLKALDKAKADRALVAA